MEQLKALQQKLNTLKEESIKDQCDFMRIGIKEIGSALWNLKSNSYFSQEQAFPCQHSEMQANIMLAYRHLEDARMRIGKILQAQDGGVSCYDK